MRSVTLRPPRLKEVEASLVPFEVELAAVFRAMSLAAQDALRSAADEGLTPDAAIDRAGAAALGPIGGLHANTEEA